MALKQPSGFMTREPSGTVERPTRKTASDVLEKLDESKVDIAKGAAEFIPGVGEAMAVKRVSDAMDEKDYVGAGIETAAGALSLIPAVGDMAGKALRTVTKTLRKDAKLRVDNPGYDAFYERTYAEGKQEYADEAKQKALKRGETDTYAANLGTTDGITGSANSVKFKPEELKDLPGTMGEEKFRSSGEKLQRLKESIKEKGYKEAPIMIHVREDGQPFIVEGNHRLAEALESGRGTITADIRYLRGAEEKEGLLDPRNIFPDKIKMAEGGAVPMKEQMEMFDDGGLMEEGGTIDPISGNDVPAGSTQEEVRDDIPAQLSEGEFVFPADVVRYIGLEKLMQMRQEAKMGLTMMDKMGQMGNSEEAVVPDDIPFELSDLDMDDEEEYNNDTVEMATGGLTGPATGIAGFVPSQVPATSFIPPSEAPVTTMPIPPTPTPAPVPIAPTYIPATQQAVPTFTPEQMQDVSYPGVVQTPESAPQLVDIVNPTTGERRSITYIPGVTQLPEGFVLASEYDAPEAQQVSVTPTVGQTSVRDDDGGQTDDEKLKMRKDKRRVDAASSLYDEFTTPANPFSFSTITGKLEPGTRTATGYIIGDNGEYLDPLTGGLAFFGSDARKYALNPEDTPDLDLSKEGGINQKFYNVYTSMFDEGREEALKRQREERLLNPEEYARKRAFKEVEGDKKAQLKDTASLSAVRKAQKTAQSKKTKEKKKSDTARLRKATEKAQSKKSASEREDTQKAIERAQRATASIMRDKEREYNSGGLASKPEPKPKQMRSGGLASKK